MLKRALVVYGSRRLYVFISHVESSIAVFLDDGTIRQRGRNVNSAYSMSNRNGRHRWMPCWMHNAGNRTLMCVSSRGMEGTVGALLFLESNILCPKVAVASKSAKVIANLGRDMIEYGIGIESIFLYTLS